MTREPTTRIRKDLRRLYRELRETMQRINREHGGLICSNPNQGYWWAANLEERLKVVGGRRKQGQAILTGSAEG